MNLSMVGARFVSAGGGGGPVELRSREPPCTVGARSLSPIGGDISGAHDAWLWSLSQPPEQWVLSL